jgi:hypothetical protein
VKYDQLASFLLIPSTMRAPAAQLAVRDVIPPASRRWLFALRLRSLARSVALAVAQDLVREIEGRPRIFVGSEERMEPSHLTQVSTWSRLQELAGHLAHERSQMAGALLTPVIRVSQMALRRLFADVALRRSECLVTSRTARPDQ